MNLKWLIIGALAYTIISKRKAAASTTSGAAKPKEPTPAETQKQIMDSAKKMMEQAESMLSSI